MPSSAWKANPKHDSWILKSEMQLLQMTDGLSPQPSASALQKLSKRSSYNTKYNCSERPALSLVSGPRRSTLQLGDAGTDPLSLRPSETGAPDVSPLQDLEGELSGKLSATSRAAAQALRSTSAAAWRIKTAFANDKWKRPETISASRTSPIQNRTRGPPPLPTSAASL